jgi:hypothetical protein
MRYDVLQISDNGKKYWELTIYSLAYPDKMILNKCFKTKRELHGFIKKSLSDHLKLLS